MRFEDVAQLPKFDTGQYEGCELSKFGGDAKLILRFSELAPFEIKFCRVRSHQFTALPNCDAELITTAYFKLVEVIDSPTLSSFIDSDRAPRRAYKELHHYRIFLDETGCHELFAESTSARTMIDALSLDDTARWATGGVCDAV